ncbi:alcohol dehydrogenase, partial [Mycobacterium sp. ITM-2017-0098]
VIRFNAAADPEPYREIAVCLGVADPEAPGADAAHALADRIDQLARDVGVPRGLSEIGVREENLSTLAKTALLDACMSTNPRAADEAQMHALFLAAM